MSTLAPASDSYATLLSAAGTKPYTSRSSGLPNPNGNSFLRAKTAGGLLSLQSQA